MFKTLLLGGMVSLLATVQNAFKRLGLKGIFKGDETQEEAEIISSSVFAYIAIFILIALVLISVFRIRLWGWFRARRRRTFRRRPRYTIRRRYYRRRRYRNRRR